MTDLVWAVGGMRCLVLRVVVSGSSCEARVLLWRFFISVLLIDVYSSGDYLFFTDGMLLGPSVEFRWVDYIMLVGRFCFNGIGADIFLRL